MATVARAAGDRLVYPVQANEVFLRASPEEAASLRALGVDFYDWAPGEIRLYPIPGSAAATGLVARASLKPSEAATGVSDAIASRYRAHIADGALSILMMDPGKAWTNLEQAAFRMTLFDTAIAEIRTKLALDSVRVRARPVWC